MSRPYRLLKKAVRSAPMKGRTPDTIVSVLTPSMDVDSLLMAPKPTRGAGEAAVEVVDRPEKARPMPARDSRMRER